MANTSDRMARLLTAAKNRKLTARIGWCAWCDQEGTREAVAFLLDAAIRGDVVLSESAIRVIVCEEFSDLMFAGGNPFSRHLREHETERYARFKAR